VPPAERVLTRRDLNRAVLARQCLLTRVRAPLPRVLERVAGLQAQYAPSMYLGLWSRVEGFHRETLTRALERRSVVQGTLLRSTIHLVSAGDYWPFAVAVRAPRRDWYLRVSRLGADPGPYEAAAATLSDTLAERGRLRRGEIDELVGRELRDGVGLWLDLVRVPPSGTWERRRADHYAAAEEWLGPPQVGVDDARELVVRRYLRGFGPATALDVAGWSGLPVASVAAVLARLPVRRFRMEDGAVLVDLPRAPLPGADAAAPVRFLPTWDATLLVHARRARILPEEYRPLVFSTRRPQSVPTFLVDGAVGGTWRYEEGRVRTEEFAPLPVRTRRELAAEGERLAAWHG
jgi:hypothetical protein